MSSPPSLVLAEMIPIKEWHCLQLNSSVFLEQLLSNKMSYPDIVRDNKHDNESLGGMWNKGNSIAI
jgi:hypothetical protein